MATSAAADATWLPGPLLGSHAFDRPETIVVTLVALVLVPVLASYYFGGRISSDIPLANPPKPFQLKGQVKMQFARECVRILDDAKKRFPNRPFSFLGPMGQVTMLPADRAVDVKDNPALNFRKVFSEHLPFNLPGFGPWKVLDHSSEILQKVIKKHLTKRLNTVTEPLARETTFAVGTILGDPADWVEVKIYDRLLEMVARLSSRVFLGADVCRDQAWLKMTQTYTIHQMRAFTMLGFFPYWLRPLIYFVDPGCAVLRKERARAVKLVEAELARRRKDRQEGAAKGVAPLFYNDAIDWAEMEADGTPYDPTDFQLTLSFAAIHTTTDLLTATLLQLAANPEAIKALRQEMLEVLPAYGWTKNSLYQLKLLDSALKEAQRMKPPSLEGLQRRATADIELPGGVKIRKGQLVSVDVSPLSSPERHEDPGRFDIYRFKNMREYEGGEHKAQLVSTVPEHITFGLGKYSCPGRFFAANEVKIALCHLLLRYDWELGPGASLEPVFFGTSPSVNPENKLRYRRRVPEIDLDSLEVEA